MPELLLAAKKFGSGSKHRGASQAWGISERTSGTRQQRQRRSVGQNGFWRDAQHPMFLTGFLDQLKDMAAKGKCRAEKTGCG
jgi:hypothetical protein